ncbi:MAG: 30S ribosomal protein S12 methylthiotransferase RimO, partial [Muribaculaceae bacterium]|nr:30S ribosomal protein S12 methylthiotransferase RimO [Muribaculaceae bacterium]
RTQRFDRMGAFAYCEEDDTWAARHLDDNIPDEIKQQRLDRLMEVQQEVAEELQQQMIGRRIKVIIDRYEGLTAVGRSQWDSPEVDPEVLLPDTPGLTPGDMVTVDITDASAFELIGRLSHTPDDTTD